MITHHQFESLGGENHGWLNAKHHFSFANYYDPKKLSHGELMVINDDRIAPQTGFDTHPHHDMEIITYVRRGAISHQDNQGNKGCTKAGNIPMMSAGSGIFLSEHNLEDKETNIFQIWIKPKSSGLKPSWDSAEFPKIPTKNALPLLVSSDGQAPLTINQDARIYAGSLKLGTIFEHQIRGKAYFLVSEGRARVSEIIAKKGDGIAISDEEKITLKADEDAELLIIEVPSMEDSR